MSKVKVNLLGEDFEKQINDSINKIEELKREKEQKVNEINVRIKKATRNYERTDSEILKKQAKKDERLAKEELDETKKDYDRKVAEEQAKIKDLVQEQKKRIEETRKNAEEMMKVFHSDIKRWSEDEATKKRLKARKSIATSIAALKDLLEEETDEATIEALERQIESLKENISEGVYTKSENDQDLASLKRWATMRNGYYKDYSDSLDKLDELEELQAQLDDIGIETEDKDFSQENSEAWNKFMKQYNKYVEGIAKPLLSNIERSEFKTKIATKVKELQSNIKASNGKIDYTAEIEELSFKFDEYYRNINAVKKQELNEKLENIAGKLSETPNLADELRREFAGKITALNTDDILMLENLKSISSEMDKKIKEIENRQKSTYPQEIIDAFEKFDKLCDEVENEFVKMENDLALDANNERNVYKLYFGRQREEWEIAIEHNEEIDLATIQEKYQDLDNRLTVYKENMKKMKLTQDTVITKINQAKTDKLQKKAAEDLSDIFDDELSDNIDTIEKFDGTPIDVSELLKRIEEYTIPEEIELDPPETFSDEEKVKREEAHNRAGKANEEFQKNDEIDPKDKKDAMNNMAILDIHLYDLAVSTEDYIKECEDFINETNRIRSEQNKEDVTQEEVNEEAPQQPRRSSKIDKLTVEKIDVDVKSGLYTIFMKSGDEIVIPTRKLLDKDMEKKAAEIRSKYGIGMDLIDADKIKRNMHDAAKNISGYGTNDKRETEANPFEKTGIVDPVVAAILVELDYQLEQIRSDLKNTNKSKYGEFILGREQNSDEFKIFYDFEGASKVKNKDMQQEMAYLVKIRKNAKRTGREDLLGGKKKDKSKQGIETKQSEEKVEEEVAVEESEEEPTGLQYKDLSERAKRVYNAVVDISKDEKKATIEEEALKGHITPEDHKQLHEIFGLGPLPVAEKKPNILKRVWNGIKQVRDNIREFFGDEEEEEEKETNEDEEEVEEDSDDIKEKNEQDLQRLKYDFKWICESLSLEDQGIFIQEFEGKIKTLEKNIMGKLGEQYSFKRNCNDLLTKMKEFKGELKQKRIVETAINIQLSGSRDIFDFLPLDEQREITMFLGQKVAKGMYSKQDLTRMKSLIEARIAMGENAEELYKKLNIDEKAQEFLKEDEGRTD